MSNNMVDSLLLIIDVQRGFINDNTKHIPSKVTELQKKYGPVAATAFQNPGHSPFRTILNWNGFSPRSEETDLAYVLKPGAPLFWKSDYSGPTNKILRFLTENGIKTVDICGINTDVCVQYTALSLFQSGFRVRVIADACGSTRGLEYHRAGLLCVSHGIGKDNIVV